MPSEAAPTAPPSDLWREQLLDAMLEIAPFEGWTELALDEARRQTGLTAGQQALAAARGVSDLIEAFAHRCDAQMVEALAGGDLSNMRTRERIAYAVKLRVETLAPHKEAGRRAAHASLAPWRAGLAPKLAWRAADAIWSALGDRSTDQNWYSKRLILSGVVATTLGIWLSEDDDGEAAWAHLDRQIDAVMQFEKVKAGAKKWADGFPDPLDILGRRSPDGGPN